MLYLKEEDSMQHLELMLIHHHLLEEASVEADPLVEASVVAAEAMEVSNY